MKTTILSLVSFLALGFAGAAHAGEGAARHGQVNVQATATKAVVAGPAVVKVYSAFSGAKVFVADAASAKDADCAAAAGSAAGATLTADRVELVSVGVGQIACVASTGARPIELLWRTSRRRRRPRSSRSASGPTSRGWRPPAAVSVSPHQDPIEPIARRRNGRGAGVRRRQQPAHSGQAPQTPSREEPPRRSRR